MTKWYLRSRIMNYLLSSALIAVLQESVYFNPVAAYGESLLPCMKLLLCQMSQEPGGLSSYFPAETVKLKKNIQNYNNYNSSLNDTTNNNGLSEKNSHIFKKFLKSTGLINSSECFKNKCDILKNENIENIFKGFLLLRNTEDEGTDRSFLKTVDRKKAHIISFKPFRIFGKKIPLNLYELEEYPLFASRKALASKKCAKCQETRKTCFNWAIGTTVVCGAASLIGNQYINWGCTIISYPRRFECWLHQMFTCYLNYCGIADYTGVPALGNRLHPYHEYEYDYGHSSFYEL